MSARFAAISAVLLTIAGCGGPSANRLAAPVTQEEWFADGTKDAGIAFTHVNGMSGQFYMPEIIGPGAALFDYDNDGDLDVFLVQGRALRAAKDSPAAQERLVAQDPLVAQGSSPALRESPGSRLYRNDLTVNADGTRTLRFTDVTAASGIVSRGYGMGVAAGDVNNDGCVDLYLTNFGQNQMFRNNCNGTFTDVSRASGTDSVGWSVSAAFVDVDRDGWLDLFVGNYLRYTLEGNTRCFSQSGALGYCTPRSYQALPSRLFRNRRDGTFSDVTARARVASEYGAALGVATADFNGDGWMDIYVANDGTENQLWLNQQNGTFKNSALISGVALPTGGKAEGSMGVDAGDFDNDGDEDLLMTELAGEGSNLYVNDGSGFFADRASQSGLEGASMPYTGFGTAWFDYDNDGWLDILAVNGTVQIIGALEQVRDPWPMHQRKLLLRNLGNRRFENVSDQAGMAFRLSEVGRGAAFGDVDNDGDVDVIVANNNGPLRLFINTLGNRRRWLGLRLVGTGGRDLPGARAEIIRKGGPTLWRRARADGSYASANDPRILAGLGDSPEEPGVRIRWPDGRTEDFGRVAIDRYVTLREGSGK